MDRADAADDDDPGGGPAAPSLFYGLFPRGVWDENRTASVDDERRRIRVAAARPELAARADAR